MGVLGCNINGSLDDTKFNQPMPWIGIYIAAASALCSIAMAADAVHGFRNCKFWFPSKFFSLNAMTLTLIAVATKLDVDLNTSMPQRQDQLVKLSSAVFMNTVMSNSMPSFGIMENKEICMNIVALGILVITLVVNICSPQFVVGRSVTCTASGALCLLSTMILAEAMFRSYLMPQSFRFCIGDSDYKSSTTMILVTQTVAVGLGTIAPTFRWFSAINFRCPKRGNKSNKNEFKVETYWIQRLVEIKESPLALKIRNRHCRKFAHDAKEIFSDMCIATQTGIVVTSKVIRFISIFFVSRILLLCDCLGKLKRNNSISNEAGSESHTAHKLELSRFVLHLEDEDALVSLMMKRNCDATDYWMCMGRREQPKNLIELLKSSTFSLEFKGVRKFDSDQVPSLDCEEPPNCWGLPVVTLTSIAVALPNVNHSLAKSLLRGVHEGLLFVKLIESKLKAPEDLINIRNAGDVVWLGVDIYRKWLDVDLRKLALKGRHPKEILEELSNTAKIRFMDFKKKQMNGLRTKDTPSHWPVKVLATNSMYRITQTLLLDNGSTSEQTSDRLFEAITTMISDILGACLTNLHRVITMKCLSSTIEEREESVREATYLLGKTEKILEILDQRSLPSFDPDQMACINDWRLLYKQENPFPSTQTEIDTSYLNEVLVTIE